MRKQIISHRRQPIFHLYCSQQPSVAEGFFAQNRLKSPRNCVKMNSTNQNLMEVISIKKHLLNPLSMFLLGLCLGVVSRLFDIYIEILGNIFSQLQIWILLGTLIAIYSPTKKQAMLNIFPFCLGMLITYYATAIITHGIYGRSFIIGWTIFAFCSPVFAYFAWMTKDKGWFPKVISIGMRFQKELMFALLTTPCVAKISGL